jgi:hypothetical protein
MYSAKAELCHPTMGVRRQQIMPCITNNDYRTCQQLVRIFMASIKFSTDLADKSGLILQVAIRYSLTGHGHDSTSLHASTVKIYH